MLSRSALGKRSRTKGANFERKIAQRMRELYDSPELLKAMAGEKDKAKFRALQQTSRVRRSDQGKGAIEPDLVIEGCPCWLELQDSKTSDPFAKLVQAEGDVFRGNSSLWPVAVVHQAGRRSVTATMRVATLYSLFTGTPKFGLAAGPAAIPVTMDFDDFTRLLEGYEHDRRAKAA